MFSFIVSLNINRPTSFVAQILIEYLVTLISIEQGKCLTEFFNIITPKASFRASYSFHRITN